jgi:GntR family transcriptional regulator
MTQWRIRVATGQGTPIYRQIVEQVRMAAATGEIPTGFALPSVRSLAEQLVINPNTVAKAYGELARDGVLESRQSLGYFVAPKRQIYSRSERTRRLRQAAAVYVKEAICLDFSADEIQAAVNEILNEHEWTAESQEKRT